MAGRSTAISVRTGLIYLMLAGWWFFASHNLMSVILSDPENLTDIQRYKLGLILVTTVLLHYVLGGETLRRRTFGPAPGRVATLLVPAVALVLLAVGISSSWFWALQEHVAQKRQEGRRVLSQVAAVQAARVGDWIERRTAEALSAAEDPLLALEVSRWLAQGVPRGETMDRLARRLASLRHAYPYEAVLLLDADTRILAATDPKQSWAAMTASLPASRCANSGCCLPGCTAGPEAASSWTSLRH